MVTIIGIKLYCPRCSREKYWILRDGRFRWCVCRKAFRDPRKRVRINPFTVRKLIQEFLLEHSRNTILSRVNICRYMLLRILTLLRMVMVQDVPAVFEGTVEVDETYLGGQWEKQTSRGKVPPQQGKARKGDNQAASFWYPVQGRKSMGRTDQWSWSKTVAAENSKTSQARLDCLFRHLARLYRHCSKRICSPAR